MVRLVTMFTAVNVAPTANPASGHGPLTTQLNMLHKMQIAVARHPMSVTLSLVKHVAKLRDCAVTTAKIATGLGTQMTSTSTTESQLLADARLGGESIELSKKQSYKI